VNYTGKAQLSLIIVAPAELEAEGDRIFKNYAEWMVRTHFREGEKALLQYNVAKRADDEGNILFTLTEVYETVAGIESHHELGAKWESVGDWLKWLEQCQVTAVEGAPIIHSLWQRGARKGLARKSEHREKLKMSHLL